MATDSVSQVILPQTKYESTGEDSTYFSLLLSLISTRKKYGYSMKCFANAEREYVQHKCHEVPLSAATQSTGSAKTPVQCPPFIPGT